MALHLTSRDEELLLGLTNRYRCISADLTAAYFWPDQPSNAANALRRLCLLEEAGWLRSRVAFAKQLPHLSAPVLTWCPGHPTPEFGSISYHLKNRARTSARSTRIFIAGRPAATHFGGTSDRWPRRSETTHDLGLTQVYLALQRTSARRARGWISESTLVSKGTIRGQKLPDAMIRELSGDLTIIEFGGEYSKSKLIDFHEDCARKLRGYELW
jgi:hypothetical protein